MSPFRAPWGPEAARYQVKVCVDHESNSGGPTGGSWDQIWLPAALRGPLRPPKGSFGAKTSPFRVPLGPEGARYQVKVCGDHKFNPIRPFEGSWDQIWSTGALLEPPKSLKGPFGTKMSPFRGPLGPRRGPIPGQRRANRGQLGPNLSTLDPPRISRAPKGAFRGPNEPFLPVFSSWVVP